MMALLGHKLQVSQYILIILLAASSQATVHHQHLTLEPKWHSFWKPETAAVARGPHLRYGIPAADLVVVAIIDSAYGTGVACGTGSATAAGCPPWRSI